MDFTNEAYVRVYKRDTTTWRRLGWEGQCTLMQLLRKVDRAGVIDIDDLDPAEACAMHTGGPIEFVREGVTRMLSLGVAEHRGTSLVFPRFLEAQESSKSDRQRQRESRERRRDQARSEPSQNVTESHAESQPVTLCSAVLCSNSEQSSAVLPAPAAPDGERAAAVAGFSFVATLLGRDTFKIAPPGSFPAEYAHIGRKPKAEQERVKQAVEADNWCVTNPSRVDAKHLCRSWEKYLAGPVKSVARVDPRDARAQLEELRERTKLAHISVNRLSNAPWFDKEADWFPAAVQRAEAELAAANAALREASIAAKQLQVAS